VVDNCEHCDVPSGFCVPLLPPFEISLLVTISVTAQLVADTATFTISGTASGYNSSSLLSASVICRQPPLPLPLSRGSSSVRYSFVYAMTRQTDRHLSRNIFCPGVHSVITNAHGTYCPYNCRTEQRMRRACHTNIPLFRRTFCKKPR
jgi:hypothetical protein